MFRPKYIVLGLICLSALILTVSSRSAAAVNNYWHAYEKYSKETNDREKLMHPEFHEDPEVMKIKRSNAGELNSDYWQNLATKVVDEIAMKKEHNTKIAKNIIMFLGDGLSIATTAAARSYQGDPSMNLAYETLPYIGMSKTYCVDRQVADSACTATAYLCGVKANYETIGVNANVENKNCTTAQIQGNRTPSIAKWAMDAGKGAGLVTTTRVTHASPTGVYAHIAFREWEDDSYVVKDECDPDITDDIAEQLVRYDTSSKLRVIMGGGRRHFLPKEMEDEEGKKGLRLDKVNLIEEWKQKKQGKGTYVWNREDLLKVNPKNTSYLLGLFESSHMLYNLEVQEQGRQYFEPTLTEMVDKAIDILDTEEKGYFLFVEGGRIDHAHHDNYAKISLDETKEFSKAIEMTLKKVNLDETLIVVTADHSHSFSYTGYPYRDRDILGTTGTKANDGMDQMILAYANGLGYHDNVKKNGKGGRVDPNTLLKPIKYRYPATLPKDIETHGGDDVGVYSIGPWAHLFTGNFEQYSIPHMMAYAACIGNGLKACDNK